MRMDDDIYNACARPGNTAWAIKGDCEGGTISWYDLLIIGLYRDHSTDGGKTNNGLEELIKYALSPNNHLRDRMEKL